MPQNLHFFLIKLIHDSLRHFTQYKPTSSNVRPCILLTLSGWMGIDRFTVSSHPQRTEMFLLVMDVCSFFCTFVYIPPLFHASRTITFYSVCVGERLCVENLLTASPRVKAPHWLYVRSHAVWQMNTRTQQNMPVQFPLSANHISQCKVPHQATLATRLMCLKDDA